MALFFVWVVVACSSTTPDQTPVQPGDPDGGGRPNDPQADTTWTLAGPINDVSTDEGGDVWAVSPDTLYLLAPGASAWKGFGNADGLHVEPFTDVEGQPASTVLTAVAGAGPNELYLGYFGYEGSPDPYTDTPEQKALGNGDRIVYNPATGTLAVTRYQFKCVVEVNRCWEDRSVRRIVVGHRGAAAGHAFFGFNHGTTHVWNDVLGDHVHPEIVWVNGDMQYTNYGECQALALNDDGTLWIGNRHGVGLMNWNPDPIAWVSAKFKIAFTTYTDDHALEVPWGYGEYERGAALSDDGTLWLASSTKGLSSYGSSTFQHFAQAPTNLVDVVADLDGTIWLVTETGDLLHFTPATGAIAPTEIHDARRLYLDRAATPRALYVARKSGVTVWVTQH